MAQQKILLKQYQEAEMESRELQEFLQAEKMTLAETLKGGGERSSLSPWSTLLAK